MRKVLAATASISIIIACGILVYRRLDSRPPVKPNILVLSACSLRHDHVPFMPGGEPAHMPEVAEFFGAGGFAFTNAFNGLGWTALFSVTAPRLKNSWFESAGYRPAGLWIKNQMFLVPPRNSWKTPGDEERRHGFPPDSNFEKNYRESLDYLLKLLEMPDPRPYFVVAQIKYPHFPLIDRFNPDSGWDRFLSPSEKDRVSSYLATPARFPAKLPLLLMLTNDVKLLKFHPRVREAMATAGVGKTSDYAFLGLLTAPDLLIDWQRGADYDADLAILRKIYRANILYLDGILGGIFRRLEQSGQLENTAVFFLGDHGEVHMERGHLTHGTSWFDPALRIPLLVRLPGQRKLKTVASQVNLYTVTELIRGLAEGTVTKRNLPQKTEEINKPYLIARDCSNTWRALRFNGKWKYVYDMATGEAHLYDLESDPQELHNRAGEQVALVAQLERRYWEVYPEFTDQLYNSCAPWAGSEKRSRDD